MKNQNENSAHSFTEGADVGDVKNFKDEMPRAYLIAEMQQRVFMWAKSKGWCDRVVPVPEQCALIHSEISEALEAWRNNEPISWTDTNGKPQGIASEYADAVIRIMHYCSLACIDLDSEIQRKMNYNDTRAYRHGNKQG